MASSAPATSLKVTLLVSWVDRFALALPKLITFELPPCIWLRKKNITATMRRMGTNDVRTVSQIDGPLASTENAPGMFLVANSVNESVPAQVEV